MRYIKLFLFLIFIIIVSIQPVTSQNTIRKYRDNAVSFMYPGDWIIDIQKTKPEIRLKPKNWTKRDHINEFAIYLSVSKAPFEKAARAAGFVKKGDKWIFEGRQGIEGDVEEIKGKSWTGLVGEAPVGTSQGLAYATTIIITDSKKSAVLTGEALGTKEGDAILNSIEFVLEGT